MSDDATIVPIDSLSRADIRAIAERELRRRRKIADALGERWADPAKHARMVEAQRRGWQKRRAMREPTADETVLS